MFKISIFKFLFCGNTYRHSRYLFKKQDLLFPVLLSLLCKAWDLVCHLFYYSLHTHKLSGSKI